LVEGYFESSQLENKKENSVWFENSFLFYCLLFTIV